MLPSTSPARQPNTPRSRPDRGVRLRQRLFRLLYGPAARVYDPFAAWLFLGEWARWQRTALPLLPDRGLVVELGAGTGALARIGARPGRPWLAIEPSPAMLAVARRHHNYAGPRFVRSTADALPVVTGAADAVVATFPAPYILDAATHAEIARVLKPGGRAVVVLSGELLPHGRRRRLRRTALRLFSGGARTSSSEFALTGFAGEVRSVGTRHGTATVYVGWAAPERGPEADLAPTRAGWGRSLGGRG